MSTQTVLRVFTAGFVLSINSVAFAGPLTHPEMKQFVRETAKKFLAKKYQATSNQIADAILESSEKFKFDPIFLMAVIQNESSFNPTRKGGVGELGLMQIRPKAAAWTALQNKLEFKGEKTLLDPAKNIRIGVAMMARLRKKFHSKGHLYLSAYNMGEGNIKKFVKINRYPRDYARAVMTRYLAMYMAYSAHAPGHKKGALALRNIMKLSARKTVRKLATN